VSGVIDDIVNLRARYKLIAQILGAVLLLPAGIQFRIPYATWLEIPLSICWVVLLTNALNLLDNIDGLSAGVALIASIGFIAVGVEGVGLDLSLSLGGAALGFLFFNFHPARVFMGDAGSLMLGFVLATIGILFQQAHYTQLGIGFVPVFLILLLPLTDTSFVIFTRLLRGQHIYFGGKDHVSHRLMRAGLHPVATTAFQYLFCILACAAAMGLRDTDVVVQLLGIQAVLFCIAEGSRKLYKVGI
jgi:UDP-GlcNAc:undecaprenyl-phosphate/decaprenyl-phosphate GlcNAc-1-phosphate transferase